MQIKCVLLSVCNSNEHAEAVKQLNPSCLSIGFNTKVFLLFCLLTILLFASFFVSTIVIVVAFVCAKVIIFLN